MSTAWKHLSTALVRRRATLIVTATAAGMAVVIMLAALQRTHELAAKLLLAVPDRIAEDPLLMRFAMPRGRAAFDEHCSRCHGTSLRGDPARGIPDLTDSDWLYGSGRVGEIERIVLYGIRSGHPKTQKLADMPAFATVHPYARYRIDPLNPRQVDDVTALLYSFQHAKSVDAATVARGLEIFHGKGLCFDCHADHANGDPAIGTPKLTDAIWLYGNGSMASIKAAISRGLAGNCPQWIDRLSPETIRSMAVYVNSRGKQS